uniref:Uncharacterized protein n=1 Tax=Peronospora matthiolae TaxID=2874970 RepID=A0AAV1TKH4_9STRA
MTSIIRRSKGIPGEVLSPAAFMKQKLFSIWMSHDVTPDALWTDLKLHEDLQHSDVKNRTPRFALWKAYVDHLRAEGILN